jgi:anti-sigma factor RsiW
MKHYTDQIQAYLSGELAAGARAEMEAHLAGCTRCADQVAEQRKLWDALADLAPAQHGASVWPAVQARTTGSATGWFFGAGKWSRSTLAAGAVAAGLMVGFLLPGGAGNGKGEALASEPDEVETLWISGSALSAGQSDLEALWFLSDTDAEQEAGAEVGKGQES